VPVPWSAKATAYDERQAFPYDKVVDFVDALQNDRDKALYSLLAACGCRTHEGLQVLLEDVDVQEGTVRLVDPATRSGHVSYRSLLPVERDQLAWKGRTTDFTLLIEPFGTLFFESMQRYLDKGYIAHGKQQFLFQFNRRPDRGRPYFLSNNGTRLEIFHRACRRVGVALPLGMGPHSFRHMYGTYLLNYFPRASGDYGLPVPYVQHAMGHADAQQTLRYAKFDNDLHKLEVQHAHAVIYRRGVPMTLPELKIAALEAELVKLKALTIGGALND